MSATLGGVLVFSLASAFVFGVDGLGVLVFALASAICLCGAAGLVCWGFRWHPRYAFALQASPLCGAAPTFLCRRKEK
jgi:hypothetical protein